jgi:hypothetical protein
MPAPHEVVAAPLTIYLADVGTAFPAVTLPEASFAVGWEKLGVNGDNNYGDAGVTVSHSEDVEDFTPAGSTMPVKRFRTGEAVEFSFDLVDVSPDTYAKVMNDASVTTSGGAKYFDMFRGDQVNSFAILGRGMSAIDNAGNAQYEISKGFVSVNGDVVWNKGTPASLPVTILAVRASASDVIRYRVET